MNSKEIIRLLEADGWIKHAQKGSHCQYKHLTKKGKVTVPHPRKDFPMKTFNNILKQAGLTETLKVHKNAIPYFYSQR
ncbi:MAG: type II toxin-antitoxin system HicA family toxin [Gammaproteobacteria bacterium]